MNLQREFDLRNEREAKKDEFDQIIQYTIPNRLESVAEPKTDYKD